MTIVKARQVAMIEEQLFCDCGGEMSFNGHQTAGTLVHSCTDCTAVKYLEGQQFPRTKYIPLTDWAEIPEAAVE